MFRFIVCQDVSVFFICLSNLNAASDTCVESLYSHKCLLSKIPFFSPLKAKLQISSFSNNADSPITCLIVIDAFDCVGLCHPQPRNSLEATDLRHARRKPKNSTHNCFCCVSNQTVKKTNKVSIETNSNTVDAVHLQQSVRLMR